MSSRCQSPLRALPLRERASRGGGCYIGEGGGTAGKQGALRLPAAAGGTGEGCAGEINGNDFQRQTGSALCMIFQFFLPTQAPRSLSDTCSSLLETRFSPSAAAFHVFWGHRSCSGNRRGGEPQPLDVAGATLSAPGRRSGDRELSFSSPDETPAGFISHYIVALKCQAAHTNLLLWGYSSRRGCYINAFFNNKTSSMEGFVLKPREIQKLVREGEGMRMT